MTNQEAWTLFHALEIEMRFGLNMRKVLEELEPAKAQAVLEFVEACAKHRK